MNVAAKITPTTILLEKLRHGHEYPGASVNARTTGRDQNIDALAGSIKAEGILQSLLVCPGPRGDKFFYVIAGNRRLAALRKLKWEGDVPVIVRDDATPGTALAMSLAENVMQCPLHPVDRFETFAALVQSGKSEADIAANFSISDRVVKQSLALGRLAPGVRQAWREGKIEAGVAKAFTLSPDLKAQEDALHKLSKKGWLHHASFVREALVGDQNDTRKFLTFVGPKAYEAAGGKLQEDLFATAGKNRTAQDDDEDISEDQFAVLDFPLLVKLAGEKIAAKCADLVKAGWSWAADADDLPDNAQYSWRKIDNAVKDALKEQKARSGCIVRLKYDGQLEIIYGVLKPGEKALPSKAAAKDEKAKTKAPAAVSNALKERLAEQLTQATQDALKQHANGNSLAHLLAEIVAGQIKPNRPSWTPDGVNNALGKIRERLPAKDFNAAMQKRFDMKGYLQAAPKAMVLKALTDTGHADDAKKLAGGTKVAAWKRTLQLILKSGWLPPELRTTHYAGPGAKKKGK